jgi:hypothetical protein
MALSHEVSCQAITFPIFLVEGIGTYEIRFMGLDRYT